MDVDKNVQRWETGEDNSNHPDYPNLEDNLSEEDNSQDGNDTGDEWLAEVKDKCILSHVMMGGTVEEIDFQQTYDMIVDRREHRRFAKAERSRREGETKLDAYSRMYPDYDADIDEDNRPWIPMWMTEGKAHREKRIADRLAKRHRSK